MPPRFTPCPTPGCPELRDRRTGDCPQGHSKIKRRQAQRLTDAQRPSARNRGYNAEHDRLFRCPVLARDPVCTIGGCTHPSEHADHHPLTRRQLVAQGLNPNDPQHGRGLCAHHHNSHTASHDGGYGNPRTHHTTPTNGDHAT